MSERVSRRRRSSGADDERILTALRKARRALSIRVSALEERVIRLEARLDASLASRGASLFSRPPPRPSFDSLSTEQLRMLEIVGERKDGVTTAGLVATGFTLSTIKSDLPALLSLGFLECMHDGRLIILPAGRATLPTPGRTRTRARASKR